MSHTFGVQVAFNQVYGRVYELSNGQFVVFGGRLLGVLQRLLVFGPSLFGAETNLPWTPLAQRPDITGRLG